MTRFLRYLTWLGALAVVWVTLQYMFIGSSRAIPTIKNIKIHIDEFKLYDVVVVQHQQIPFVLIHKTDAQIAELKKQNSLRSIKPEYFIALAIGTDLGCIIVKESEGVLKESCSQFRYDYSGRLIQKNIDSDQQKDALKVPQMSYNQNSQFFNITLK